jgi:capsule polysaccharide export protein KpsE/RkpR
MSQTPVTVTYSLEDIFGQIQQQLLRLDQRFDTLQAEVTDLKIHVVKLEAEIASVRTELKRDIVAVREELKGEISTLSAEVQRIGKRLDTQEFINRSVVVGFVLALTAGAVKLFFPEFPN